MTIAEYIERAVVIDLITRRYENPEICTQEINSIPAADVAPVLHAQWIGSKYDPETGDGKVLSLRRVFKGILEAALF